jgi:hypothetical protein
MPFFYYLEHSLYQANNISLQLRNLIVHVYELHYKVSYKSAPMNVVASAFQAIVG